MKMETVDVTAQRLLKLAFLSVKRIILMNWKVRKPGCFCLHQWLKDFVDLIMMERAAGFLQDLYSETDSGDDDPWILIQRYLNERQLPRNAFVNLNRNLLAI